MTSNLHPENLLHTARLALEDRLKYQTDKIIKLFESFKTKDQLLVDVITTLWVQGEAKASGIAHHLPLDEAVYRATIYALDLSCVEGQLLQHELNQLTVEVAVLEHQSLIEKPYKPEINNALNEFKHGLRLTTEETSFDLLPAQIIRHKLKTLEQQIAFLLEQAELERDVINNPNVQLFETQWKHLAAHADQSDSFEKPLFLTRHRVESAERISNKTMLNAATECGTRLTNTQAIDGTYLYTYQAWQDEHSNENYNIVRLAGTAFSMTMLTDKLKHTPNHERFIASAHYCLRYLFYLGRTSPYIKDGMYIAQEPFGLNSHTGKLGTTALTLLALQFGEFYEFYTEKRLALIETILFMQRPDGSFYTFVPTEFSMKPRFKLSSQNYFPGEALLALCYELEHKFRPDITEAIAKAFDYYRNHFKNAPDTAFVLWQVSTWAKFHQLMQTQPNVMDIASHYEITLNEVADFIYEQTDWIIQHQYTEQDTEISEYVGGFPKGKPPHSVSSCYVEAIIRATELASQREDHKRLQRYRKSALEGLSFLRRLQIKKEEAFLVPNPNKSIGGISGTLTSFQLRNDRDQHAITAYLAAVESPGLFESEKIEQREEEEALV